MGALKPHQNGQPHSKSTTTSTNNKRRPPLFSYPDLPESFLCLVVTVVAVSYGWWCVYSASQRYAIRMAAHTYITVNDLPLVGKRFKDTINWEWSRWSPFALGYLPLLFLNSLVFNLGGHYLSEHKWMLLTIATSISTSAFVYTPTLLLCSLLQGVFIFGCTYLHRSTISVWLSSLPILYIIMNHSLWLSEDPFLVLLFVPYTLLSEISFCLEWVNGNQRKEDRTLLQLFTRMLFYTFYQPYLVSLIVLYTDFERQISERSTRARNWPGVLLRFARVALWWVLIEVGLHFFYFESMLLDGQWAAQLPKNEFVTLGMALGSFFHIKYVVIFGLPAAFALLDNMQPLPGPICISRVALYSKIWRGFDRGLYAFFKQYLFLPICAPTFSAWRKVVGVLVSYTFVLLWHGFHHQNMVWIGLNVVELFVEYGAKGLYSIPTIQMAIGRCLSAENLRRLLGWLQIIPFAFGLYSNFYFLGGSQRIFWEETVPVRWPFLLLITVGYFYMQVGMELDKDTGKCPFTNAPAKIKEGEVVVKKKVQ